MSEVLQVTQIDCKGPEGAALPIKATLHSVLIQSGINTILRVIPTCSKLDKDGNCILSPVKNPCFHRARVIVS